MASAFGSLNGSGPQQVWVSLDYVSYNQAGNYSSWDWEVRYYGNGHGSWSGGSQSWSLSGFAVGSGTFELKQADAFKTYIVLASGRFTKGHNADGYLSAGTLTATIDTNHSAVGDGSASVSSGTPPRIPKAPDAPAAPTFSSVTSSGMTVAWSAPDNNGSSITGYDVQWSTSSSFSSITGSASPSGRSHAITGLDPAKTYYVRVRAENGIGTSGWSATGSRATAAAPPDTPSAPTFSSVTSSGMTLSWSAPANNGAAITGYDIQWSTSSGFSGASSASDSASPYAITGLDPATTYYVRFRAKNSAGTSGWSSTVSRATAAGAPSAPATPTLSAIGSTGMTVSWSAPDNNGAAITGYDIQWSTSSSFSGASSASDSASPYGMTGLKPSTTYYVRVRAKNSAGTGGWSSARSAKTLSAIYFIDPATNIAEPVELLAWTGTAYVPVELFLDPELDGTFTPAG